MTDREIALAYYPVLHRDEAEPIPLRAVGYTVMAYTQPSRSFPGRTVSVPEDCACTVEYAFYYDYDIEHMNDLEHVWVTVGKDGSIRDAQGSFHGKYLNLLVPALPGYLPPENGHVHAYVQPGKHAMLAAPCMVGLFPNWEGCCRRAGGPVLIGNPFGAAHSPTGKDLFVPAQADNRNSIRYLRDVLSFEPSLRFRREEAPAQDMLMTWDELFARIPAWVSAECERLGKLYEEGEHHGL